MLNKILLFFLFFAALEAKGPVHIAFVMDGKSPRYELVKEEVEKEIRDLLMPEWNLTFVNFVGDWSVESVRKEMEKALNEKQIDIVIMLGVIASGEVGELRDLPKPIIAPFVMDQKLQRLPITENDTSGVKNLNYLTFHKNILDDLLYFREIVPWKNLSVIGDKNSLEAFPEVFQDLKSHSKEMGFQVSIIPIGDSVEEALGKLSSCTDAVYLTPLPRLTSEQITELANGLIAKKIPSFTLFNRGYVDHGILASIAPDTETDRMARRIALNVQSILSGEDPADLSTILTRDKQLTVNAKTAQDIGLNLPWKALLTANLVDEDKLKRAPKLSLVEAVEQGLQTNPSLSAVWREVLAGLEELNLAKARLRLQVDISSIARLIDADRAVTSGGFNPQAAVFGTARASQMLYSNQLIGDVRVQRFLQYARCENYRTSRLDLVFEVGSAYFDLLRAQSLETIQRNNLKLTEANLQTAQKRVLVGVARLSEVYRWETQVSENRTSVVDAYFQTLSSEVVLSRLLNLPQDKPFNLVDVTLEEPDWLMKKQWIDKTLKNPAALEVFTEFAVVQGFYYSPEIKELQDQICAQAEVLGIATRAFWQPDFNLIGEMRDRFCSGGKGRSLPLGANTTEWLFGIEMNFQLYTGGQKAATQRRACQELVRLKYLFLDLLNRIEGQIRVSINQASASFAAIGLAKKAAESAQKNLDLILEGYAKGTENILDLLDAQNQALNNDQLVVNAIYDFLNDSLAVQRAVGRFDFLLSFEEQQKWVVDLEKFMQGDRNVCARK